MTIAERLCNLEKPNQQTPSGKWYSQITREADAKCYFLEMHDDRHVWHFPDKSYLVGRVDHHGRYEGFYSHQH